MTQSLSFDDLQAILHQGIADLPDHRKPSPNTRYTMQDAALGAFGIFFTQAPSFLEYQRRLQASQGRHNAQTLFGVQQIPCDNQIRTLLDPIAPSHCDPIVLAVFQRLEQHHLLDSFRVLGDQLLVALDGTTSFSSQAIHCPNCLTRQLSNGHTLSYHPAITPVVVSPRRSPVIALPPEYLMPQDGHAKQDCEQMAGTRWIRHHAQALAPHHVTLLGEDLYSKQPFWALALAQGFNFIVVCQPDSHPKLYERVAFWHANDGITACERRHWNGRFTDVSLYRFLHDVLLLEGQEALPVNWFEITVINAKTGEQLYHSRYPRAYARGTWELKPEIQLCFARVDFLLKLNISFDDVFVDHDRGGEKTDGPKFVPPVYLLDPGKTLANFPTRVGFDLANDLGHGILGGNHDHQMNMIDLDAQRLDFNVRMKRLNVE